MGAYSVCVPHPNLFTKWTGEKDSLWFNCKHGGPQCVYQPVKCVTLLSPQKANSERVRQQGAGKSLTLCFNSWCQTRKKQVVIVNRNHLCKRVNHVSVSVKAEDEF